MKELAVLVSSGVGLRFMAPVEVSHDYKIVYSVFITEGHIGWYVGGSYDELFGSSYD